MTTLEDVGREAGRTRMPLPMAVGIMLLVLAVLPESGHRFAAVPGLTPAWLATLLGCDVLTAVLLVGRFRTGSSARLLVLACGYVWSATTIVAISLAVPGVLSDRPPIDDPNALWWLWVSRHVVPPAFIAVALAPWPPAWRRVPDGEGDRRRLVARVLASLLGLVLVLALVADRAASWLPGITRASGHASSGATLLTPVAVLVVVLDVALVGAALLGAVRRRSRSDLEAWALVAAVAYLGDVVLSVLDEPPFSLAYFAGRSLGLLAGICVLLFMLRDVLRMHRLTSEDAARLQEHNQALLDASRLRDHLVAVVSHEMRTPLAGLQGYLELLSTNSWADTEPDREAQGRMLERSWLLTRRLTLLAEDLLAVAAVTHGEFVVIPETVNLAHQLDECAGTFPDLDLRVECPSDVVVHADTLRLQQILTNLVRNAQKHGAEPITIACAADADQVTIRVADSGPGVPRDFVHRLFERYAQGDNAGAGGSGLGLSVVRDLVRAHGGSVRYDLTDPAFVVTLPQRAGVRSVPGHHPSPAPTVPVPAPESFWAAGRPDAGIRHDVVVRPDAAAV